MHLNALAFSLVVALGSFVAGFLGSLTGLGGGVVIVPLLTLLFGVDMRYAIGASLVSVIATSSGAAAAYLREGYSNMRVGMFLEIATTVGAISGAVLAAHLSTSVIAIVFGLVLLYSAYSSTQIHEGMHRGLPPDSQQQCSDRHRDGDGAPPPGDALRLWHPEVDDVALDASAHVGRDSVAVARDVHPRAEWDH